MYPILPEVYDELADRLHGRIGDGCYFSGTVECQSEDVWVELRATLIIYRHDDPRPDGCASLIDDIVPVWWECHTMHGSEEMLNEFDFAEIKSRLIR